jgi:hypothetical protein
MTTEASNMADDRTVLAKRRALPGQASLKAYHLDGIRELDASITHYIIAYSAGDKKAAENLERCKAERAAFVTALRNITKD